MTINCFYFGKYAYTFVPWQIEEDLRRIKNTGATSITLNVIEQDYKAAFENISLVIALSRKLGLRVYALPDGWGNLVGNISGFPSVQAVKNQQDCLKTESNENVMTDLGWLLDPDNKKTFKFFKKKLKEVFSKFNFDGVFWYHPDDTADLVSAEKLFRKAQEYLAEEYSDKTIIFHPKDIPFLEEINVNQTMSSVILPKTESELSSWEKPENEEMIVSYYDYPPNVENSASYIEQLEEKLEGIF